MTLITLLFGLLGTSHAASVTVCAEYKLDYVDVGTGDDYLKGSTHPAWGAKVQVRNGATQVVEAAQFTDWDGATPGCTTFTLTDGVSYQFRILSTAEVRGHTLKVKSDDRNNATWATPWSAQYTAPIVGSITVQTGLHRAWRLAAAMGWSFVRRSAPFAGATITGYTCGPPWDVSSDCLEPNEDGDLPVMAASSGDKFYVGSAVDGAKFVISHELGHTFAYLATGDWPLYYYGDIDSTDCFPGQGSHYLNSEEFESAAALEGWAWYYAAVAFNNTTGGDCWAVLPHYSETDWDYDDVADGLVEVSCEAASGNIPASSYFDTYCDLGPEQTNNRGNEWDWARFFWDMDANDPAIGNPNLTWQEVVALYVDSNPPQWMPNQNGTGPGHPSYEMYHNAPAALQDNFTLWSAWNGTNKGM